MSTKLQDFREQYPQYRDLDDETLAARLYTKFYSDLDPADFRRRIGLAMPEPQRAPSISERIDAKLEAPETRERGGSGLLNDVSELAYPEHRELDVEALRRATAPPPQTIMGFLGNAARLAAQRATTLGGEALEGIVGRPGEAKRFSSTGSIVFGTDWGEGDPADGRFRVRWMQPQELEQLNQRLAKEQRPQIPNMIDVESEYLKTRDFGGKHINDVEAVKRAYDSGDVSDTLGAVLKFGLESGIESVPDMAATIAGGLGLAAYAGARSSELAETRARNKGEPEATLKDQLEAMPGAIADTLLASFGAHGVADAGKLGKEALEKLAERGLKAGLARVAAASAKAAGKQAAAMAFQSGIVDYLTERLGTNAGMSVKEAAESGALGALAGGVMGLAAGGLVGGGRETLRAADRFAIDRTLGRRQEITERARQAQAEHFGEAGGEERPPIPGEPPPAEPPEPQPERSPPPEEPRPPPAEPPAAARFTRTVYRGSGRSERGAVYADPESPPILGPGRYYAFSRAHAEQFGPDVEQTELRLDNPLVIDSDKAWSDLTRAAGWKYPNPFGLPASEQRALTDRLQDVVRARGHDGVVIEFDPNYNGDILPDGRGVKLLRNVFDVPQAVKFESHRAEPLSSRTAPPKPGQPVELTGEEFGGVDQPIGELKAKARRYAYDRFAGRAVVNASDGSKILIPRQGIKHSLAQPSSPRKVLATAKLDQLIENGRYVGTQPDKAGRQNVKALHSYETPVHIAGEPTTMRIVVREALDGRRYYDHFEVAGEPSPGSDPLGTAPGSETHQPIPGEGARPAPGDAEASIQVDSGASDGRESTTAAPRMDETADTLVPELGNQKAFAAAAAEGPHAVAAIRAPDLPAVERTLGPEARDAVEKAVAHALATRGLDAYRVGPGEYRVIADSEQQLGEAVAAVKGELGEQVVEVAEGKLRGVAIESGVGHDARAAEAARPETPAEPGDRLVLNSTRPIDMTAGTNYVPVMGINSDYPFSPNGGYRFGDGRVLRIPKEPITRRRVLKELERKLGVRIYQGRVRGKGRLGFYRPGIGEIRTKFRSDLEVTAHELAHWLDDRFTWVRELYKRFRDELLKVSYDDKLDYEGFAEFARLWFTQEHEARRAAPSFYDAWMSALKERPKLGQTLLETQEQIHAWYLQGERARLAGKIGKDKLTLSQRFREAFNGVGDKILQRYFDGIRQFKVVERAIRGELADATFSGYLALRLARGSNTVMQAIYHRGTIGLDADGNFVFTGDGLKSVFSKVEDRMPDMQAYMVARRAQELRSQGRENLISPGEIAAGLAIGERDPAIAKAFDEWLAFNKRMLDFYEQTSILSPDTRAAIEELNKNYVPFNRVVDTLNGQRVKRGGGSPFVRLKGGTSNINDVFDSIVTNNTYLVNMALRNHGKRLFYRMVDAEAGRLGSGAGKHPMAGFYATPIAKDVKPVTIDRNQVVKAVVEGLGLNMRWYRMAKTGVVSSPQELTVVRMIDRMLEGMPDLLTFFKPNQDPKGNVDFYFERGQKRFYEINDPLLYEAIQQLGPRPHNLAVSILGGFSSLLRRGVTATPTFQVKNFIRDTMNAFTLSRGHIVPAVAATKALLERVYNDEHYWRYVINGGGFASAVEAEGIRGDRVITTARSMLALYDRTISSAEYANRVAEFKALVAKGYSPRQAAYLGREISTDFAMRGSSDTLRVLTIAVPFLNARLQGLYRIGRELGEMRGGRARFLGAQAFSFALRAGMAITLPSLWLYFRNKDDPRYQEMQEWVKDLSWVIFTGDGEDDYVLIPKPYEIGMLFGTLPERMVEYSYGHDGRELADAVGWMLEQAFNFDPVPQAFQPLDDLRRNQSWTGAPIVPDYLNDVEPQEQYRAYTSDAMIALGRKLGISPLKAEYVVRGYMGTLGSWLLGAADYVVGDLSEGGVRPASRWQDNVLLAPFVRGGPLKRTKSEDDFYEILQQARQAAATLALIERRSPDRAEAYVSDAEKQVYAQLNASLEKSAATLRELNNAMDAIRSNPTLTAADKRDQIEELQRAKNTIAREIRLNVNRNVVAEMAQQARAAAAGAGQ